MRSIGWLLYILSVAFADEASELKYFEKCWDTIGRLEQSIPQGKMGQQDIKIRRQIDDLLNTCGQRQTAFTQKFGYEPDCKTSETFVTKCRKPNPQEVADNKAAEKHAESEANMREIAAKNSQKIKARQEQERKTKDTKEKGDREALWK